MSVHGLSPELASEVSSRLHADIPDDLRRTFQRDSLPDLDGEHFEGFLMAAWLSGYSAAMDDAASGLTSSPVYQWFLRSSR